MRKSGERAKQGARGGGASGLRVVGLARSWGQVALGAALAATGTVAVLHPVAMFESVLWWLLPVGFLSSLVIIAFGIAGMQKAEGAGTVPSAAMRSFAPEGMGGPRLGTFLVENCHLITEEQLQRALARQRETGDLLGRVLVGMGVIREAELEQALRMHSEVRGVWRGIPRHG